VRRPVFTILACVSLVLSVATLVLWARGRFVDDTFLIGRQVFDGRVIRYRVVEIGSGQKTMGIAYRIGAVPAFNPVTLPAPEVSWWTRLGHNDPAKEFVPQWARTEFFLGQNSLHYWHGFIARHNKAETNVNQSWAVGAPCWFVVALMLIIPLAYVLEDRRRKFRRRSAACEKCGYNLTGNVSGVCPECGTTKQA
jgi:hypothetical protein